VKQQWKDYFAFNKRERNGIIVLLGIMLILLLVPMLMSLFKTEEKVDFSAFEKEILEFEKTKTIKEHKNNYPKREYKDFDFNNVDHSVSANKLNPFPFDPNFMTDEQWRELGLTEKQIKTLDNYVAKGGKFFKKEDFQKMYCISKTEYEILEPFINIAAKEFKTTNFEKEKDDLMVELNSADTTELKKLKGIGKWISLRIIKRRDSLGGFIHPEQLLEVKGIDRAKFDAISAHIKVNRYLVEKLNINTASFIQMKRHPYIGPNIALSIINYRNQHGKYQSVSELKNSTLITDAIYNKISPYLEAE